MFLIDVLIDRTSTEAPESLQLRTKWKTTLGVFWNYLEKVPIDFAHENEKKKRMIG